MNVDAHTFLRFSLCALWAAAACLFLPAAPSAQAQNEQSIVVLVNDEPITNYDVRQRMRLMTVTTRREPDDAMRKKAIEDLIAERIQLQEASKNGVVLPEDEVEKVFAHVAKGNNMTSEQMESSLAQLGVNVSTMKEQIRAKLSWKRAVQRKFSNQVSVNASQIDEELSKESGSSDQGEKGTEFQLQRVQLGLPDRSGQDTIAARLVEADRLRSRVRSCSDIAEVVRPLRNASVKSVGRKTAEQVAQPTRALLRATKEGGMTPPIITSSGVELYVVCAKRTVVSRDEEQRQEVRRKLLGQEYDILAKRHMKDLRQEAYVEYR